MHITTTKHLFFHQVPKTIDHEMQIWIANVEIICQKFRENF